MDWFWWFALWFCGVPLAVCFVLAIILLPMYRREKQDPEYKAKRDHFRDTIRKPFARIKISKDLRNIIIFLLFLLILYLFNAFPSYSPDDMAP